MSLRLRLAAVFALGAAVLIGAGGWLFLRQQATTLHDSAVAGLEVRAAAAQRTLLANRGSRYPAPPSGFYATNQQDELFQLLNPSGKVSGGVGPGTADPLLSAAELTRARAGSLVLRRDPGPSGEPMLLLATPVGTGGEVQVNGVSLGTAEATLGHTRTALAIGGPVLVALAGFAAWWLAGAALRPVERMRRQAADISEHDRDAFLDIPASRDEVAALGRTLNELLARLEGALHRERGFVAAAGHELRSPLANLKVELELAARPNRSGQELVAAVSAAATEVDRLSRLAEDLLVLACLDEPDQLVLRDTCDLVDVLAGCRLRAAAEAARRGVRLEISAPPSLPASVDEVRLRQVLDNLTDNALRFAPAGSAVELSLRQADGEVTLEVADRGPGFPADFLPRAFERFSRPDRSRSRDRGGAGLGLAIVKAIAQAHGGRVAAGNRSGGGALVQVVLPRG
jgi:two-component system OmpR family sensor kinase